MNCNFGINNKIIIYIIFPIFVVNNFANVVSKIQNSKKFNNYFFGGFVEIKAGGRAAAAALPAFLVLLFEPHLDLIFKFSILNN